MKFIKVIIDGKEYYQMVEDSYEEAKTSTEAPNSEPAVVDAEIEDGEPQRNGEKFKRDAQEFFGKIGSGARVAGEKFVSGMKDLGDKINAGARDINQRFKEGTERLFNKDKSTDPNSTEAKLLKLLPYMSKKEAHGLCEKLLDNDESLKKLNIATIMPFISADDCDAVFIKSIELNNRNSDLGSAVPFVSRRCLERMVDDYIAGKYPELDIDELYPFLADAEIKKLFYHILNEEK